MPRTKKERLVRYPPPAALFRPIGIPSSHLGQVELPLDEYEALRLVDYEAMDHAGAASELGVSRATCARILESARRKIAEALVNGCSIRIEGGNYRFGRNRYRCMSCGNVWETGLEESREAGAEAFPCPQCDDANVVDLAARVRAERGRGGGAGNRRGARGDQAGRAGHAGERRGRSGAGGRDENGCSRGERDESGRQRGGSDESGRPAWWKR